MQDKPAGRIKILFDTLRRWLAPPVFPNERQASSAAMLNAILLFIGLFSVLGPIFQIVLNGVADWDNLLLTFLMFFMIAALRAMIFRGYLRLVMYLFPLGGWLYVTIQVYNLGTIHTAHVFGYVMVVVFAALVCGEIASLLFYTLAAISVVVLSALETARLLPVSPVINLTNQVIVFVLISFEILFTMILARKSTLKALQAASAELEQRRRAEKDLLEANALLDQRVQQRTAEVEIEIEKHVRTTEALVKSEEWFRTVADYTYSWEYFLSPDGKFLYVSPHCELLTGYPPQKFTDDPRFFIALVHPDDRFAVSEHVRLSLAEQRSCIELDFRIIDRNGKERWIAHVCRPVYDKDGAYRGQRASNRDVTNRKNSELRLRQLSQAVEQNPSSIVITDLSGAIEYVNPKFTEVTGYSMAETLGKNPRILQSGLTSRQTYDQLWGAITAGSEWRGEFQNRRKNGELYWESAVVAPVTDENGLITHYVAIKEDITERRLMETALKASEQRFRSLFDNSPFAYQSLDGTGCYLDANENLCALLGYAHEELISKPFSAFLEDNTRDTFLRAFENFKQLGSFLDDISLIRKDGHTITVLMDGRVEYDISSKFLRTHCILTNITEREQMQAQLRKQNESMAFLYDSALDFLRDHDLKDLLSSIADHALKLLEVDVSEIFMLDGDVLVAQNTSAGQPYRAGDRIDRKQAALSWQAVDSLQPAIVADYSTWESRQDNYPQQIYLAASFPIISNNRCMGVLDVGRYQVGRPFTADELHMAQLFIQVSALAIENAQLNSSLLEQSIHDPLTGLHNRRFMFETLQRDLARSIRDQSPLGFVMMDIDKFKKINDRHGHGAGDAALVALAAKFKAMVRAGDILCRYGGDEHLIVLHNASAQATIDRAEQWRKAIENMEVRFQNICFHITISMGVSSYPIHGSSIDELISCADKALYSSKKLGRNCVTFYEKWEKGTKPLTHLPPGYEALDNK